MEMMKKGFSSIVKLCVLVLFATSLCFVYSCKKSSQEPPSPNSPGQPTTKETKSDANDMAKAPSEISTSKPPEVSEAPTTAKAGWAPIDIKLPKPMFVGTPQDTTVPNLEKPLGKERPPFLAPIGTKNVAFEKPVTSTDDLPIIGELEMLTDGDKEAADGSYVELGPFKQSVTIDLEAEYNIYAIVFWHYHKQAVVYFDVVVQVADDPDFITNVTTLFNNDIDNSAGLGVGEDMHYTETAEGKLIDAKSVRARYVRLYSNGNTSNDLNHYIEVEVFGKPAI